jgi:hypothetical protein
MGGIRNKKSLIMDLIIATVVTVTVVAVSHFTAFLMKTNKQFS